MTDFFTAISEDGVRFKLNQDGTWAPDISPSVSAHFQFRSSRWGDSIFQVKTAEGGEPTYENSERLEQTLVYDSHVAGFRAFTFFRFFNGMCCSGSYDIKPNPANKIEFFDAFCTLEDMLTVKYGQPNDLYAPSEHQLALAMGSDPKFSKHWQDDQTSIQLKLCNVNKLNTNLYVFYSSKRSDLDEAGRLKAAGVGL